MSALLVAVLLGAGTHQLVLALLFGRRELSIPPLRRGDARRSDQWTNRAGLGDVRPAQVAIWSIGAATTGAATGWLLFAGPAPAAVSAIAAACTPIAAVRNRARQTREAARETWPQLIEEIRLGAGALGRSIPVALLDAGANTRNDTMRAAFEAASREWLLTTDFERCTRVLTELLDDATADAVCEMLLVAHELGGRDLDRRLAALAEDRRTDLRHRAEARSRQAGARFSRWFVLVVPIGMAAIGGTIGGGREAYRGPGAQAAVVAALGMVAACWWWAGRIMRVPEPERVLGRPPATAARGSR